MTQLLTHPTPPYLADGNWSPGSPMQKARSTPRQMEGAPSRMEARAWRLTFGKGLNIDRQQLSDLVSMPARAELGDRRDEGPADGSDQPGRQVAMALLFPDPRPRMTFE